MNQDQGFMYMMDENRVFYQNNEIPFDQLHYDRKLSEGGYGIVYRGRWKYTTVAIKEIKKEIIEQDKLEEFKNECAKHHNGNTPYQYLTDKTLLKKGVVEQLSRGVWRAV